MLIPTNSARPFAAVAVAIVPKELVFVGSTRSAETLELLSARTRLFQASRICTFSVGLNATPAPTSVGC